jgi:hypothetical protein
MEVMNRKLIWLIGILCVAVIIVIVFTLYRKSNPYLNRQIAGPVTIASEWLEITPEEPLKPEREIHEVILEFATPYEPDYQSWGIRLPDKSLVIPEVQLVDQNGGTYKLRVTALDRDGIAFSVRDAVSHQEILPKDKLYSTVRIRIDKSIQCSKIIWSCYNPWDRK